MNLFSKLAYKYKYKLLPFLRWLPVIWKDMDIDFSFTWIVLLHKIRQQRKLFQINDRFESTAESVLLMYECEELLERIIADDYLDIETEKHEMKWGEPDMKFVDVPGSPELKEVIFESNPDISEEDAALERKEYLAALSLADSNKSQHVRELLSIIKDNYQSWWD